VDIPSSLGATGALGIPAEAVLVVRQLQRSKSRHQCRRPRRSRLPERLLRLRLGKGVCMNDCISHPVESLALAHPQTYTLLAIGERDIQFPIQVWGYASGRGVIPPVGVR
jgi:hypothetical protein